MTAALKPHPHDDEPQYRPVSFMVSAAPTDMNVLTLPQARHLSRSQRDASLAYVNPGYVNPGYAYPGQRSPSQLPSQMYPQRRGTSSALPVPISAPPSLAQPRRVGVVQPIPRSKTQPRWLRRLRIAQQSSVAIASILLTSALSVYGWTVHSQQQWSDQYDQRQALQGKESGMSAMIEAIRAEAAQRAEQPGSRMEFPAPDATVYLTPEPPRVPIAVPLISEPEPGPRAHKPIGY